MKTDVKELDQSYEMDIDLPGFKKEDIQLQLDGDTLTIQAQRHSEHEEQEKKASTCAVSVPTARTAGA